MIDRLRHVSGRDVSRETLDKVRNYAAMLAEESSRQNLVSKATLNDLWDRHVLDSAQLLRFAHAASDRWVDIGSGGGLPGVIIACMNEGPVTLVEPRRLRAEFLQRVIKQLDLNASVIMARAERLDGCYDIVTGRAVAGLSDFLQLSQHLSTQKTRFILPKGRSAESELDDARRTWQGVFHVEQSLTDDTSFIVVGDNVRKVTSDQDRGSQSEGRRR